jgi:hypothetical protein
MRPAGLGPVAIRPDGEDGTVTSSPRQSTVRVPDLARAPLLPFVVIGTACVIAGGLVSAASAPHPSEHGSWAAAYLVLVAGVAQIGLGAGQSMFGGHASQRTVLAVIAGWNLGNAAVLAGTLADVGFVVDLGGAALLVVLVLLLRGALTSGATPSDRGRWLLRGYRALLALLIVSIPVGLVLERVQH